MDPQVPVRADREIALAPGSDVVQFAGVRRGPSLSWFPSDSFAQFHSTSTYKRPVFSVLRFLDEGKYFFVTGASPSNPSAWGRYAVRQEVEHRYHERHRFRGPVTIHWSGAGGEGTCVGNCFDVSTYGLLVVVPISILRGSKAIVEIPGCNQSAEATVRHCRKQGAWYRIGLNFTTLLQPIPNADVTWDPGG